jgi:hypothetical protein
MSVSKPSTWSTTRAMSRRLGNSGFIALVEPNIPIVAVEAKPDPSAAD